MAGPALFQATSLRSASKANEHFFKIKVFRLCPLNPKELSSIKTSETKSWETVIQKISEGYRMGAELKRKWAVETRVSLDRDAPRVVGSISRM